MSVGKTVNHTPSPWCIDSDGAGKPYAIITSTHLNEMDDDVCEVYGDDDDKREANARLISAAPDLLAALVYLLEFLEANDDGEEDVVNRIKSARTAIAKATGNVRMLL